VVYIKESGIEMLAEGAAEPVVISSFLYTLNSDGKDLD
jgi:hypothetical protein